MRSGGRDQDRERESHTHTHRERERERSEKNRETDRGGTVRPYPPQHDRVAERAVAYRAERPRELFPAVQFNRDGVVAFRLHGETETDRQTDRQTEPEPRGY